MRSSHDQLTCGEPKINLWQRHKVKKIIYFQTHRPSVTIFVNCSEKGAIVTIWRLANQQNWQMDWTSVRLPYIFSLLNSNIFCSALSQHTYHCSVHNSVDLYAERLCTASSVKHKKKVKICPQRFQSTSWIKHDAAVYWCFSAEGCSILKPEAVTCPFHVSATPWEITDQNSVAILYMYSVEVLSFLDISQGKQQQQIWCLSNGKSSPVLSLPKLSHKHAPP